ncbi:MAG TPA: hypothetical protein VGE02_11575 [Gemmatimonadales bacterium]
MTRAAVARLRKTDPRLRAVIDRVGPCRFAPRIEGTHFDALVRAIVYQQLSGKAAATIHGRVRELFDGRDPLPAELLAAPDEPLRAAGLSRQKLGYLRSLAGHVADDALPLDRVHEMDDQAIIDALVAVKGIGRWTAQMFLMFRLGRLDVLPDLDLGVQKGVQLTYDLPSLPTPKEVVEIGAAWAPYRSVGSWYMWRLLDE